MKWGTAEHRYKLNINSDGLTKNQLEQIFSETALKTIKEQKLKANDKIRIVIQDPNLKNGFASIPLMDLKNFSINKVFKVFEEVVESNEEYEFSPETSLIYTSVNMPDAPAEFLLAGSYVPKLHDEITICPPCDNNLDVHKLNKAMKKSIIQIKNKDDMCVARAVATGMIRVMYGVNSKEYDNCKRGRKIQEEMAREILETCKLPETKLDILTAIPIIEKYYDYLRFISNSINFIK